MKSRFSLIISLFSVLLAFPSMGAVLSGDVVSVVDGDTFHVMCSGRILRVRCLMIDTPELHHPVRGVEEFGPEASDAAALLLKEGRVRLETAGLDRYGRTLAHLWYYSDGKAKLLSAELCRRGLALPLFMGDDLKYTKEVEDGVLQASNEDVGLWGAGRERLFSPGQIVDELTSLRGFFVTVRMHVARISESRSYWRLIADTEGFAVTVRKEVFNGVLPDWLAAGVRIEVVGKVTAGYGGAEIPIGSATQISTLVRHI